MPLTQHRFKLQSRYSDDPAWFDIDGEHYTTFDMATARARRLSCEKHAYGDVRVVDRDTGEAVAAFAEGEPAQ